MKVIEINSVCGIGSTGRIAAQIADLLNGYGDTAFVAYGRENSPVKNSVKISCKVDNYFHVAITRLLDLQGYASVLSTRKLLRFMNEFKPDLIHLHNIHGYYLNYGMLFRYIKRNNIPVIWTLHDSWAYTGHCVYYDYSGCDKWKTGCGKCPLKREYPSSCLLDSSSLNYQKKKKLYSNGVDLTIVTPSHWLASEVKNSFLNNYPINVIHNGIDLSQFCPQDASELRKRFSIKDEIILLGVASGFDDRKGLKDFIRLAEMVSNNYRIILVGCEKFTEIENKKLLCVSRTENVKELAAFYSLADVFLNLTYEDNFPTVNLESLACGTPVITYRTGGSPESIDENCGMIVEKGDTNAVLEAIQIILKRKISPEACIEQSKKFDKNINFKEYVDLIHLKGKQNGK